MRRFWPSSPRPDHPRGPCRAPSQRGDGRLTPGAHGARGAAAVRSEFRSRLSTGAAASLRFATGLPWGRDRQVGNARGRQRTDSTPILAAVRALNRIEVGGATLRHARHTLAVVVPAWRRAVSAPDWRDRDARRAEDDRLPTPHAALTQPMGHEGWRWLAAIDDRAAPPWRREVPAVASLRRVGSPH